MAESIEGTDLIKKFSELRTNDDADRGSIVGAKPVYEVNDSRVLNNENSERTDSKSKKDDDKKLIFKSILDYDVDEDYPPSDDDVREELDQHFFPSDSNGIKVFILIFYF